MSDVVVKVNGKEYTYFESVNISKALDALVGSFSFNLTQDGLEKGEPWLMKPGDLVVIWYSGNRMLTGYIDSLNGSLTSEDKTISVNGREITSDLIDCSAPIKSYNKTTIKKLAEDLVKPFPLINAFLIGVDDVEIGEVTVDPGQSAFEVLDEQVKKLGYLMITDTFGNLLISKTDRIKLGIDLVEGDNIKSISLSRNHADLFREYQVVGQDSTVGDFFGPAQTEVAAKAMDMTARTGRRLIIVSDEDVSKEKAEKRAQYEAAIRKAKSYVLNITVQDWVDTKNRLLKINRITYVYAPSLGVQGTFITEKLSHSQSQGTETQITLVPSEVYKIKPIIEEKDEDGFFA